ncbi:MAG TPA: histidine kinase [Cellulomonas sp.]
MSEVGRSPGVTGGGIMHVAGPLMGIVWLVFLVQPFQAAWDAPAGTARDVSLAAIVVQAVAFASLSLAGGPARRRGILLPWAWSIVAVQVVCVALATLAAHEDGLIGLVFVAVSGVLMLPGRPAIVLTLLSLLAIHTVPRLVPGWEPIDDLSVSLVLAVLAVWGFRQVLASNHALRAAQDEVAALAVDRERERIARDMHDILGHTLTVVAVKAELAGRLVDLDPERARDEIGQVQSLARSALADVRSMVAATREMTLVGELAGARQALDAAGIAAEVPSAADEVPDRLRPLFAWTVREGTTNVLRHAAARTVRIALSPDELVIEDDGRGPTGGAGHGLTGLAERARAVGAVVDAGPGPAGGYRLRVRTVPV